MNTQVRQLLDKISRLEDELQQAVQAQEAQVRYRLKGKKVEFEASVLQAHRRLKNHFVHWLVGSRPQNLITGPIIYSMTVPLLVLDLFLTLYQATCFPVYGIAKVRRSDFIVYDRQQLEYLNVIEKFHCSYCAYGSGLLAMACEVVGRTEAYFCPVKHVRRLLGTHAHYARFLDYGEADDYAARLEAMRVALGQPDPVPVEKEDAS